MKADKMLDRRGAMDGRAVWLRIASAIGELQRREVAEGVVGHQVVALRPAG